MPDRLDRNQRLVDDMTYWFPAWSLPLALLLVHKIDDWSENTNTVKYLCRCVADQGRRSSDGMTTLLFLRVACKDSRVLLVLCLFLLPLLTHSFKFILMPSLVPTISSSEIANQTSRPGRSHSEVLLGSLAPRSRFILVLLNYPIIQLSSDFATKLPTQNNYRYQAINRSIPFHNKHVQSHRKPHGPLGVFSQLRLSCLSGVARRFKRRRDKELA